MLLKRTIAEKEGTKLLKNLVGPKKLVNTEKAYIEIGQNLLFDQKCLGQCISHLLVEAVDL